MEDRAQIQWIMYGTAWKEDDTRRLVRMAIDEGFRAIDTANQRKHYFEAAVGEALEEAIEAGECSREELFLQTKFTYLAGQDDRLPYDRDASFSKQVEQSFESSLAHLRTDFVDSYVLHGPSQWTGLGPADREVWAAMEDLFRAGQCRFLGVSNVSADQLEELLKIADIAPKFVQNRCFARTGWDQRVRQICQREGIVYQGFSLLTANQRELSRREIKEIAARHDKTVAQVVFRFATQLGMLPLTGTTDRQHMRDDLAAKSFVLTEEEVAVLKRIA